MDFRVELLKELSNTEFPIIISDLNQIGDILKRSLDNYINIINKHRDSIELTLYNFILKTSELLIKIHSNYTKGQFLKAYQLVNEVVEDNTKLNIVSSKIETDRRYWDYNYKLFYRSRTEDPKSILKRDDMFHIPFSKRYIVGSQRFSAPGVPCLYLGSSSYVCWLEAGRPSENEFYVSAFYPNEGLNILDLTLTPLSFSEDSFRNSSFYIDKMCASTKQLIEDITKKYEDNCAKFNTFLATYPITIACGLKVASINERLRLFKEEYVIPQLILQSLTLNQIDGVSFLSTNLNENKKTELFTNYAFPAKSENEDFFKSKFCVSEPISLAEARNITNYKNRKFLDDFIRALKDKKDLHKFNTFSSEIVSVNDSIFYGYSSTDFATIDNQLRNSIITLLRNEDKI